MERAAFRSEALEIRQPANGAGYDRREQRFLAGEVGIDRRLARGSHLGNVVDAGASIALLEKQLLGRIENAGLRVAGKILGRPAPLRAVGLLHVSISQSRGCARLLPT